ncbi:MAG: IS1380 family transposase, partial [bacterium]|nr:IS1380 family transposase [bacterium]
MVKGNSVARLGLEVGGGGLVGHGGLWLLGGFADRMGVGRDLSAVFGPSGVVHDRGTLLVHAMLMLAGGGEACSDIEFLRSEPVVFGPVASDSTLYRTMRGIGSEVRAGLAEAMSGVRRRVWDRFGGVEGVVLDIDSSVHEVHSENKEGAAATYRRSFGFHPIYCFSDRTGECLAVRLRAGNAAANDIGDHTDVLDRAIGGLPDVMGVGHRPGDDAGLVRREVRVRADSAAGPGFAKECRRRNVGFSFVARGANQIQDAIERIGVDNPCWQPAIESPPPGDGPPPQPRAWVADLTDLVNTTKWPKGTRLIVRREPLHPGAQRSLFPTLEWRYWGHWTDSHAPAPQADLDMRRHARIEGHIARLKDSGANRFPFTNLAANQTWLTLVTWADALVRWFQHLCLQDTHTSRKPDPKHCAGPCGTPPPGSYATPAAPPYASPQPGPPAPSSPPPTNTGVAPLSWTVRDLLSTGW